MRKVNCLLICLTFFSITYGDYILERDVEAGSHFVYYGNIENGQSWVFILNSNDNKSKITPPPVSGWFYDTVLEGVHSAHFDDGKLYIYCNDQMFFWRQKTSTTIASDQFIGVSVEGHIYATCNTSNNTSNSGYSAASTDNSFSYNLGIIDLSILPPVSSVNKNEYIELSLYDDNGVLTDGDWTMGGHPNLLFKDTEGNSYQASVDSSRSSVFFNSDTPGVYNIVGLKDGTGEQAFAKVTVLDDIVVDNEIWWHGYKQDGVTQLEVSGYPTLAKIHTDIATTGQFEWEVVSGTDLVDLRSSDLSSAITADTIVENNDNSIYVVSTAPSLLQNDVKIKLTHNGVMVADVDITVYSPSELKLRSLKHFKAGEEFLFIKSKGYNTEIIYLLNDQFGDPIPHYPVGEFLGPVVQLVATEGWPIVVDTSGGFSDSYGIIPDNIRRYMLPADVDPDFEYPQSPLLTTAYQKKTQKLRAGVNSSDPLFSNTGILLRTNTLNFYADHASVTTNGVEIHEE